MKPRKPRKMWANIGRHFIQLRLTREGALEAEEQEEHSEAEAVAVPVFVLDASPESLQAMKARAEKLVDDYQIHCGLGVSHGDSEEMVKLAFAALGIKANKKKARK